MRYTEEAIKTIITSYIEKGIVTRDDCDGLDSRPYADEVFEELKIRGYSEALMSEPHLDDYSDYSRVIFNPNIYDYERVNNYMIQNVLK